MESRAHSRQGSPVPRRLGSLSVNQRSYSRVGSKGNALADDSLLMSPLPYVARRRSVTFGGTSTFREERPGYNPAYSASAPVSPVRAHSPPPPSILKTHSQQGEAARGAAVERGEDTTSGAAAVRQPSPPRRCRSDSRQRIAARRNEAQLHHSFYDDSFVEEFVLSTKSELEREEALKAQLAKEERSRERAERRVSEASEKLSALQQAKKVLLSTSRRAPSVTPSPARDDAAAAPAATTATAADEALLRELESDPDPQVQAALETIARASRPRAAAATTSRRRQRSIPIVAGAAEDDAAGARKRAKLEKLVSEALAQRRLSKSKRSVVVINWSDDDEDEEADPCVGGADVDGDGAEEAEETPAPASYKRSRQTSRARRTAATATAPRSRSLQFADEDEPILLPRRQHQRPKVTRSLSNLNAVADALLDSDQDDGEAIARRPPARAPRAPRAPRARRPAAARAPTVDIEDVFADQSPADDSYAEATPPQRQRQRPQQQPPRRAAASASQRRRPVSAGPPDRNDPMAVFFDAAFPSPSKFDEMLTRAGGVPETRRAGRGGGRQPNLVLPTTIGRRY